MSADEDFWRELLQDGDSDDEAFEGFTVEELAESELRRIRKDVETARFIRDLENDTSADDLAGDLSSDEEDVGPAYFKQAYDCAWLGDFTENSGPKNIDSQASESDIFSCFFTEEVVSLLVEETNRYYKAVIESKGGVDSLPKCLCVCTLVKLITYMTTHLCRVFFSVVCFYVSTNHFHEQKIFYEKFIVIGLPP